VVEVGRSAAGEPVYATPEMIEAERGMLRWAYNSWPADPQVD